VTTAPPSNAFATPDVIVPEVAPANELVVLVQRALLAYGFYSGPLTGVVDAQTEASLLQFQREWKLPQTGNVTPEVINALKLGG
jgi:peptidoglycan hydrolase-like protein with peptidoglycan-binding domain